LFSLLLVLMSLPGGQDFWLTKLNQFNGNFVNAEMVKAFIVSGEYRHRFGL